MQVDAANRVVTVNVRGELGDQELLELAGQFGKQPGIEPDFALLIDLREAHGQTVTAAGVRALAAQPLVLSPGSRRAIVVPSDLGFGMARMYEMLRETSGATVRIFRDFDEAARWVRASGDQEA